MRPQGFGTGAMRKAGRTRQNGKDLRLAKFANVSTTLTAPQPARAPQPLHPGECHPGHTLAPGRISKGCDLQVCRSRRGDSNPGPLHYEWLICRPVAVNTSN